MILVPYNHHDDATLTIEGSPPPSDTSPVTNTQNSIRGEVWRNPDTDNIGIIGNLPNARPINWFGMFGHRTHGASIRLQLFSGPNLTGTQLYDSGVIGTVSPWAADTSTYNWGGALGFDPFLQDSPFWIALPDTYSVRSYRISFSNFILSLSTWPGNDSWHVMRFVLGNAFEPITGPAFGASLGLESNAEAARSHGGSLRTSEGGKWRTQVLDLNAIRDSEARFWRDMARLIGFSRDFVVSLYDGEGTVRERDYTMLCKFSALDALNRQAKILTRRLQLQEV